MSTITCLKELNKKKWLEFEDIVIFTVNEKEIVYTVKSDFLNNKYSSNNRIFEVLELNKNKISEKEYGYTASSGYWPETEYEDYPALTRLVRELYNIIEERKPKYTKYNRFEIMDI